MDLVQRLMFIAMLTTGGSSLALASEILDITGRRDDPSKIFSNFRTGNPVIVRYLRGEQTAVTDYGVAHLPVAQCIGAIAVTAGLGIAGSSIYGRRQEEPQ